MGFPRGEETIFVNKMCRAIIDGDTGYPVVKGGICILDFNGNINPLPLGSTIGGYDVLYLSIETCNKALLKRKLGSRIFGLFPAFP